MYGRGGWTWYTGSSSWFYKAGIEDILGFKVEKNILKIAPCIPSSWKEYTLKYRFGTSIYIIEVKNFNNKSTGIEKFLLNGKLIEKKEVELKDNGEINKIEIYM